MRVLLVEDNPDDAALSQRAVLRAVPETELKLAHDGQEAVDRLLDPSQPLPDLVLLDLKLPRVDGIEVLRRVRAEARTALVPIVMLTSSDERSDVAACYGEGVNSYLRKPVDFDQFMLIVGNAARYWLNANVAPPLGTLP
jgi:two-component system response regulator